MTVYSHRNLSEAASNLGRMSVSPERDRYAIDSYVSEIVVPELKQ